MTLENHMVIDLDRRNEEEAPEMDWTQIREERELRKEGDLCIKKAQSVQRR